MGTDIIASNEEPKEKKKKKLNHLLKSTQLGSGRAGIQIQPKGF